MVKQTQTHYERTLPCFCVSVTAGNAAASVDKVVFKLALLPDRLIAAVGTATPFDDGRETLSTLEVVHIAGRTDDD